MDGTHLGDWGHFYHQSSVLQELDNEFELTYLVCNLEQQTSLNFGWREVGLTVGDGGELRPERCAALRRTNIPLYKKVTDTGILFAPRPERRSADAYVSDVDLWFVPEILENKWRINFGREADRDAFEDFSMSVPDELRLQQRYVLDDNAITIELDWSNRNVRVVVDQGFLAGIDLESAANQLNEIGYEAQLIERTTIQAALEDVNLLHLDGDLLLSVSKPDRIEAPLVLTSPYSIEGFVEAAFILIDADNQSVMSGFVFAPFGDILR